MIFLNRRSPIPKYSDASSTSRAYLSRIGTFVPVLSFMDNRRSFSKGLLQIVHGEPLHTVGKIDDTIKYILAVYILSYFPLFVKKMAQLARVRPESPMFCVEILPLSDYTIIVDI